MLLSALVDRILITMPELMERSIPADGPAPATYIQGFTRQWIPRVLDAAPGLELAARVLRARGFVGDDRTAIFLEPSLKHLHDPSLMPDVDRAARRILDAAHADEPIVIYGDYDVDGITSTAILFHTLRALAPRARVSSYVPHRIEEGYGLNSDAVREIIAGGARVIVSVDCGVTAIEPARVARDAGVDLIITDHHNPPARLEDLPEAFAVVHPRRPDSTYPFGDLCGAGVAYKLAWRLCTLAAGGPRVAESIRALLLELLSFTALGTIADVVPLLGENRILARAGLSRIKHSSIPGLRALVEASGLGGEKINAEDVGFRLAPRLNACGRLGHARDAVELLTTAEGSRASEIAEQLNRLNEERRATERDIFEHAAELAVAGGMTAPDRRAIVLAHAGWHTGVVGIVCSRLVERYHRPTILLGEHDGLCHGSGRSIDGFNLHGALQACARHLLSYGGHDMAAGLKLLSHDVPAFREAFIEHTNAAVSLERLMPRITYDADAALAELDLESVRALQAFAPFGRENPPVRLRVAGVRILGRPELLGRSSRHLTMTLAPTGSSGRGLRVVGWDWGRHITELHAHQKLDVLIEPKLNSWNGRTNVEGELIDLRVLA